ncbi:MAG TPA: hypothetical protein VGM88_33135 [Kofleriaceae bacterium]
MREPCRTFLDIDDWPRPRSTLDMDVLLPAEIVVDLAKMSAVRAVVDRLGYEVVESGKYMHWERRDEPHAIRLEFLAGPVADADRAAVQLKGGRVRPRGELKFHAFYHPEALALDVSPTALPLADGVTVLVPNPYSFLVMKLHAFRDRVDEEKKDLGRHHALDIYRVVAMLRVPEDLELVAVLAREHAAAPAARDACAIVREYFTKLTSIGTLRMREHQLATREMPFGRVIGLLRELFPA